MKILLYYPKLEEHKDYHYIPLTALTVASELLMQGHEVIIWDDRINNKRNLDDLVKKVDEVMISAFTGYQLSEAYKFAKSVKEIYPEKNITLGGHHATALPEQTLDSEYINEVCCGDYSSGDWYLPYFLIDIENYINPNTERFIFVSSYGCGGQCTFCATKQRKKLVFLPFDKIEVNIDNMMKAYPFKECVFFDATLFTKPDRTYFIASLMKKYNLQWICDSRADEVCKMSDTIFHYVMNSGLKQLTIGLESGSQRIVDNMKKGKDHLIYFKQAIEKLKRYPVKVVSGVVFGTPGETVSDLCQTIDFIKQMKEINPNFYISTTFYKPLPNTEMCDMCKEYGYIEPNSLEEWAELGEKSHYNYNQFNYVPWIVDIDEYKKVYEKFRSENKELFV